MTSFIDLPIVDILNVGLSGFCFLIALLGYFLLLREQKNASPREIMLQSINSFVKKTLLLGLLVGAVTVSLHIIQSYDRDDDGGASITQFIDSLPSELIDKNLTTVALNIEREFNLSKTSQKKIRKLDQTVSDIESEIISNKLTIEELNSTIQEKEAEINKVKIQIQTGESSFLSKIANLNREIPNFGGTSINPLRPFDEKKRKVNMKIQTVLAELNFYTGKIDGDNKTTTNALIAYQKSKGFTIFGYLAVSTTNAMVRDHLRNAGVEI